MTPPAMTPERWERIEALFHAALDLPPAERSDFVARAGADDPELGLEVGALLAAHEAQPSFLREPVAAAPRTDSEDGDLALEGERIGRYRVERPLGRGGMGQVYLATREEEGFRQHVALKVIRRGMDSADILRRFAVERQILASLNHPNIAHLLDVGETADGRPYLAMEYVDGVPITAYCDQHRLPVEGRLRLFATVCAAVHYAHQNLVVHRDLKPSNILVTADGATKLLDFGIAKLLNPGLSAAPAPMTRADVRLLTPEYASPEQIRGGSITTASDVYSLGVLLYELLTGHRPYRLASRTLHEVQRVVCEEEPERPSTAVTRTEPAEDGAAAPSLITPEQVSRVRGTLPERLRRRLSGDLDTIVLAAMRKEPERRYQSAERLAEDIDRHLSGLPVHARPNTFGYRARKFARRHRAGVSVAAAVALLLVGFSAVTARQSARIRQHAARVAEERDRAEEVAAFLKELFETADPGEDRGRSVTARELLDRGAARIERRLGSQPAVQADMMDVMSEAYQNLGLYAPAERLARRAVEARRALARGDDAALAASLVGHAKALHWTGEHGAAESRYREALAMQRRIVGDDHPTVALTLTYLGSVLQDRGRDTTAERLYREAIAIQRRRLGTEHADLALSLNNLGVLLRRRGDLAGAEAAHREALATRRAVLGDDHPLTIQSLSNVAIVVGTRGDLDGAEPLLREVLARWRGVLGDRHPSVADALVNLAGLHMRRREFGESARLYREALAIRRERLGERHPAVAQALYNVGVALQQQGDVAGAEHAYRAALAIRVVALGEAHPSVKATREALASLRGGRAARP